jgi:hypothetical protein
MAHLYYDASFRREVGHLLHLKVLKSHDQFRIALYWRGSKFDVTKPAPFGHSEGRPLVNFHLCWERWRKGTWVAKLNYGMGAGYIGGATAYLGRRCKGGLGDLYRPKPLAFGLTRNANAVPYPAR